jgi:type III pantothenate kinase
MLLAVDARNRSLSLGFREGGEWLAITRLGVSPERSADEYAFFLEASFRRASGSVGPSGGTGATVGDALISSVVPSLTPRFIEATERVFGVTPVVVGPGVRTGIKIRTDLPSEVGSDLVCSALAAREIVGKPCLVVNFGTVLSVSAVDADGDFVGAAFAPGLATAAESLRDAAAQIPEVRLGRPERAIGRSTAQSVQSGLAYGYGGLVARLIEVMSAELLAPPSHPAHPSPAVAGGGGIVPMTVQVVGTGGEEGRALLAGEGHGRFIPDLVLEGLAIIAARS